MSRMSLKGNVKTLKISGPPRNYLLIQYFLRIIVFFNVKYIFDNICHYYRIKTLVYIQHIFFRKLFGIIMSSLKDKVVLITGSSSGIGAATALEFATKGSRLSLVARNIEKLEEVANEC